ncbi:unnamed protein product [Prunus armeniaca]
MKLAAEQLCFSKPTKEMANHLRPLFIKANFGGIPIPKVMVDGDSWNPGCGCHSWNQRIEYCILCGGHHFYHLQCIAWQGLDSPKLMCSLHPASTIALWNEEGYMEIVEADPRPFLSSAMCFEARYYYDDLGPFTFLGVNQNGRPHGVTAQRLIEDGLASSREDWNRPFVLNLQNSDV